MPEDRAFRITFNREISAGQLLQAALIAVGLLFAGTAWVLSRQTNEADLSRGLALLDGRVSALEKQQANTHDTVVRTDARMQFVLGQLKDTLVSSEK